MAIKAGDQAIISGRRVEAVEPYKVKNNWVVRIISGPYSGQTRIMSTGTLAIFQVSSTNERE